MSRRVEFGGKTATIEALGDATGPVLIHLQSFKDSRGTFLEVFNTSLFRAAGLPTSWPQDNVSHSREDVIRGIHIQQNRPQGKLIICLSGRIIDVAVDLRIDSKNFGKAYSTVLRGDQATLFWIPSGFGHGFRALEASTIYYKCTTPHDPASDGGINPLQYLREFSSELITPDFTISAKDRGLPSLVDYRRQRG